jgi:hypothetical protein
MTTKVVIGHKITQLQWTLLMRAHSHILVRFGMQLLLRIPKCCSAQEGDLGSFLLLVCTLQSPSISIAPGMGGRGWAIAEERDKGLEWLLTRLDEA